ncbi:hypothetical protein MTO96_035121 [Rhipicephalus appendiculatus]
MNEAFKCRTQCSGADAQFRVPLLPLQRLRAPTPTLPLYRLTRLQLRSIPQSQETLSMLPWTLFRILQPKRTSTPDGTRPTSNAACSDFTVFTKAVSTMMKSFEDTNACMTRALARTALPPAISY